jgi:hypothetical protein
MTTKPFSLLRLAEAGDDAPEQWKDLVDSCNHIGNDDVTTVEISAISRPRRYAASSQMVRRIRATLNHPTWGRALVYATVGASTETATSRRLGRRRIDFRKLAFFSGYKRAPDLIIVTTAKGVTYRDPVVRVGRDEPGYEARSAILPILNRLHDNYRARVVAGTSLVDARAHRRYLRQRRLRRRPPRGPV